MTPPPLVMHSRRASPACLSPSPLSQDIPACEEHADVQIPQVMREFITRGAMGDPGMATRSEPGAGEKLEAGQGGSGCRQRDAHTRRQAGMGPSAPQAGGPAGISPLLLGTTLQTMNQVTSALSPSVFRVQLRGDFQKRHWQVNLVYGYPAHHDCWWSLELCPLLPSSLTSKELLYQVGLMTQFVPKLGSVV